MGNEGSSPSSLVAVGSTLYFTAGDDATGLELWKTDGTREGTVLVKDIRAGKLGSSPSGFTAIGSTVYFWADDNVSGFELWKTDGTASGTVLVEDILPGGQGSSPSFLTAIGSTLYFRAMDDTSGQELWKTDGTAAGTVRVKDIVAEAGHSFPQDLVAIGPTLYFTADDGASGWELWKSDGSDAGTVRVGDIRAGSDGSFPTHLTAIGSKLYFQADDGVAGTELWVVRDNRSPTDVGISVGAIAENNAIGGVVGRLSTVDPDTDEMFTYSLVEGAGSTDNGSFGLTGSTLTATAVFDFETKPTYSIRVRTTDAGGLSTEKIITITVTDVFERPRVIVTTGGLTAATTTYGRASAASRVKITGSWLAAPIVATAPAGFEVSRDNVRFGPTATFAAVRGKVRGTVFVRLTARAGAGTHSGSLGLASAGASARTVPVPSSTVRPRPLSVIGLGARSKTYDGTTVAELTGAAGLFGRIGRDDVSLSGTPIGMFAAAGAGARRPVVVEGLSLAGALAGNYTLLPLSLTATIRPRQLEVRALDAAKVVGAMNPPLTATIDGFAAGESVVTALVGAARVSTTATAASLPGTYPVRAARGTLSAIGGNYTFRFVDARLTVVPVPSAGRLP